MRCPCAPWARVIARASSVANPKSRIFTDEGIIPPNYVLGKHEPIPEHPIIQNDASIKELQRAGSIVRKILTEMRHLIAPGISTADIETFVAERCLKYRVYPSSLGYQDFPSCACTSLNDVAIHGLPSSTDVLHSGDLLSVDLTIFTGTVHCDACETFLVVDENERPRKELSLQKHLLRCAKRACEAGIAACAPGAKFSAIFKAISQEVFEEGCRVIAGIGGHGIGEYFHGPPYVAHCIYEKETADAELQMQPGYVFTIEPAIAAPAVGLHPSEEISQYTALPVVADDGWCVRAADGALTAQFEETVLVTDTGVRVLTR